MSEQEAASRHQLKTKEQTLAELKEENEWKNDLVLFWLPQSLRRVPAQSLYWLTLHKMSCNI